MVERGDAVFEVLYDAAFAAKFARVQNPFPRSDHDFGFVRMGQQKTKWNTFLATSNNTTQHDTVVHRPSTHFKSNRTIHPSNTCTISNQVSAHDRLMYIDISSSVHGVPELCVLGVLLLLGGRARVRRKLEATQRTRVALHTWK